MNTKNQPTVALATLGCKVSQYETEALTEAFEREGFSVCGFDEVADVYVINTCTVTGTGDKKSMQTIRRCHRQNPEAAIVVTGCLAQRAADSLTMPGVRLVIGTQRRGEVVGLVLAHMGDDDEKHQVQAGGEQHQRQKERKHYGENVSLLHTQHLCE